MNLGISIPALVTPKAIEMSSGTNIVKATGKVSGECILMSCYGLLSQHSSAHFLNAFQLSHIVHLNVMLACYFLASRPPLDQM